MYLIGLGGEGQPEDKKRYGTNEIAVLIRDACRGDAAGRTEPMDSEKALRLQDLFPGTHIKTVQGWARQGKVPGAFQLNRVWLIRQADWLALVERRKAEALAAQGSEPADCQVDPSPVKN
jgi:hypothetical protein